MFQGRRNILTVILWTANIRIWENLKYKWERVGSEYMTIGEIEEVLIKILAAEKAYNLPAIAEKYGLACGTESEAMSSKSSYLSRRLKGKSNLFILDMALRIAKDYNSTELRRAIALYNDMQKYQINGNIRRVILDELCNLKEELEGEKSIVEFLNRIWELKKMPSIYSDSKSLEDDIFQHMMRNDDWSYNELFDTNLDIIGSDDEVFTKFLETLVDPVIRKGSKQREMLDLINSHIAEADYELTESGSKIGMPVYKLMSTKVGVDGQVKNIIFAADGLKPELVFTDAVNNDISIVKNEGNCLVFDKRIPESGLKWDDLVTWWSSSKYHNPDEENVDKELFMRLEKTLDASLEKSFFRKYYNLFKSELGGNLPALIPQVYLHYDPKTIAQLKGEKRLVRQRMDFLMLLSNRHRIIIEIDGKHHYTEGEKASPKLYSEMVAEDRRMKLAGYDLYRFGGYELSYGDKDKLIEDFFRKLFDKYEIRRS